MKWSKPLDDYRIAADSFMAYTHTLLVIWVLHFQDKRRKSPVYSFLLCSFTQNFRGKKKIKRKGKVGIFCVCGMFTTSKGKKLLYAMFYLQMEE